MARTSHSLLDRLQGSSSDSVWRELVDLYAPLLDAWLARFHLQAADREDIVQEALTTILQQLPNFRHNGATGSFRSWLRAIVVNRLRESWRKRKRQPRGTGDSDFAAMLQQLESPDGALCRQWDQEHDRYVSHRLLARIQRLFEPTTIAAFRRVVMDGKAARDVATELGISINAVLIAKSRVLRQLRKEIDGLTEING